MNPDAVSSASPFGSRLTEAIRWFLINGTDLIPHLADEDLDGVMYVGRRVEHCWRALEHFLDNWVEKQPAYDGDWPRDSRRIAEGARRLPDIPDRQAPADAWAACAHDAFEIAGDAVHRLEPRIDAALVEMRIAREAFSIYRLAKYRWTALAADPSALSAIAYQVLEG